ncbi:MAG: RNA-binding protein [Proteobacteria bacterium]|nr:RNA-binding protein [Pseudomonadota bacterium]
MNITVLNLARTTTAQHLIKLFTNYGTVQSCDIVIDKQSGLSKGFGFIKMLNDEEANVAVAALHVRNIGGNKIRVKVSNKTNEEGSASFSYHLRK